MKLTPEQEARLKEYVSKQQSPSDRILNGDDGLDLARSMFGLGKFRNSERYAENAGEAFDSIVGAPVRDSISSLQDGNYIEALKKLAGVGEDPVQKPTGVDIASKVTKNPFLGTALATAVDVGAQIPVGFSPGVMGKVDDVASGAKSILSKIDSPEKAVALKGAEREQYLKALDELYGDRAKRAKDMGFSLKKWFHGTSDDFDKFSSDKLGTNFENSGSSGYGHYFTNDPEVANRYAQYADTKKDKLAARAKNQNTKDAARGLYDELRTVDKGRTLTPEYEALLKKEPTDPRANVGILDLFDVQDSPEYLKYEAEKSDWEKLLRSTKKYKDSGGTVYPVYLNHGRPIVADSIPSWSEKDYARLFKQFRDKKADTIGIRNVSDALDINKKSHIAIIPRGSENRIRSVNAAFDPRFKDSDLLLAGRAGALPVLPNPNEEQRDDAFKYIKQFLGK